jgi:starch synthase (maltosyl-transferring)
MPMGFEWGFRQPLDVVKTAPTDWEEPLFDIRDFVRHVLELKEESPALRLDGVVQARTPLDGPTLILEKRHDSAHALLLINKDWHEPHEVDPRPYVTRGEPVLARPALGTVDLERLPAAPVSLEPAEVAAVLF